MSSFSTYRSSILIFALGAVLFYAAALVHVVTKPGFPPEVVSARNVTVNGTQISGDDEMEFTASFYKIGDRVEVGYPDGSRRVVQIIPYSAPVLIFIDAFVVLAIFCLGLFVYLQRPNDKAAVMFHLSACVTGIATISAKTVCQYPWHAAGPFLCLIFVVSYTIVPVFFLHFTFVFPSIRWKSYLPLIRWLYGFGCLLGVISAGIYIIASEGDSIAHFRSYGVFSIVQNLFDFLAFLAGIATIILSYRSTQNRSERKRIRWVLFGCSVGPAPYIFGWVMPYALGLSPWIPETVFKIFLLLVPVTLAISIVRYRALDIDLVINRSMVYGIVITLGALLYILVLAVSTRIIDSVTRSESLLIGGITAGILALMFEPARRRVQQFVDRSFFRVQYDFRIAQKSFVADLGSCIDSRRVAELLVGTTQTILQPERIGYFSLTQPGNRLRLVMHIGFDLLESHGVRFNAEELRISLRKPLGLAERVEPGVEFEIATGEVFGRWGIALAFPMISEEGIILGFLVCGPKKSGFRYTAEDMDLLASMTTQAGMAMERIALQERLLLEKAESERLGELNRMKSWFVSSVSHDLKTPLTSIRMFAEILRTSRDVPRAREQEFLEIIEGESDRLTRLINNVLDFAKIERGVKEYRFMPVNLNECVEQVLAALQYQFRMDKFSVTFRPSASLPDVMADADAVKEACINLLANAMKYSRERKEVDVTTFVEDGAVKVSVRDHGIGIAPDDQAKIFDPFYRSVAAKAHGAGGAGLGLSLVRHIMESHGGRAVVTSGTGEGSTFTLVFPAAPDNQELTEESERT